MKRGLAGAVAVLVGLGGFGLYSLNRRTQVDLSSVTASRASSMTCPASTAWTSYNTVGSNLPCFNTPGLAFSHGATNLCLRSEEFDNASWTKSAATVTANGSAAPDATTGMDKIAEDATTAQHAVFQGITVANTTVYTYSVWLKAAERTWAYVSFAGAGFGGSTTGAFINLTTGACGTVQAGNTCSVVGASGLWRVSLTRTSVGTVGTVQLHTATADGASAPSYAGAAGSGIYAFGAQLETGAVATNYIPTGASQVARLVDNYSVAKPSVLTDTAGCVSAAFYALGTQAGSSFHIVSFGANGVPIVGNAADTTGARIYDGTNLPSKTGLVSMIGRTATLYGMWFGSTLSIEEVGTAAASGSYDGTITTATMYFGTNGAGSNPGFGFVRNVLVGPTKEACR
jgi:hypothetical protein